MEEDLAGTGPNIGSAVYGLAIETDLNRVRAADGLECVPLTRWALEIASAAEINYVLPIGRFLAPVDAAPALESDRLAVGIVSEPAILILPGGHASSEARREEFPLGVLATDEEKIAGGALKNVAFNGGHKGAIAIVAVAVRPAGVEEETGISSFAQAVAVWPVAISPAKLEGEMIILESVAGREVTKAFTRDADGPICDRKDPARIVVASVHEPGVKAVEVLAIEESDRCRVRLSRAGEAGQAEDGEDEWHWRNYGEEPWRGKSKMKRASEVGMDPRSPLLFAEEQDRLLEIVRPGRGGGDLFTCSGMLEGE